MCRKDWGVNTCRRICSSVASFRYQDVYRIRNRRSIRVRSTLMMVAPQKGSLFNGESLNREHSPEDFSLLLRAYTK